MLVGIIGPKESGKSTLALQLCEHQGFKRMRFADTLKEMLVCFFRGQGCPETRAWDMVDGELKEVETPYLEGRTPRWAMQSLGTEWGRRLIADQLWVNVWRRSVEKALAANDKIVVDDVRFANEAKVIKELGGTLVRLERDGCVPGTHASEREYLTIGPDFTIMNPRSANKTERLDPHMSRLELLRRFTAGCIKHLGR
jgi:hypothetical protein